MSIIEFGVSGLKIPPFTVTVEEAHVVAALARAGLVLASPEPAHGATVKDAGMAATGESGATLIDLGGKQASRRAALLDVLDRREWLTTNEYLLEANAVLRETDRWKPNRAGRNSVTNYLQTMTDNALVEKTKDEGRKYAPGFEANKWRLVAEEDGG